MLRILVLGISYRPRSLSCRARHALSVILMFKRSPCGLTVDDKGLQPAFDKHDASSEHKRVDFSCLGSVVPIKLNPASVPLKW